MNEKFTYPTAHTVDTVDTFHGTKVPDPYRWLEDAEAKETRAFIDAQNELTESFLAEVPARAYIHRRLTMLWDYAKYQVPTRRGARYFYWKNDGLQNQAVMYLENKLDGKPQAVLDANTLSDDGTAAVTSQAVSPDGKFVAYGVSVHGSDWQQIQIRDVDKGKDLKETLEHCKFSSIAWAPDGSGFFYDRYPDPASLKKDADPNANNALYFHKLNTAQSKDVQVHADAERPELRFPPTITDDDAYIVLYVWHAAINKNRLYYRKVADDGPFTMLIDEPDAGYHFVGNDGATFFILTDKDAPKGRLVAVDLAKPEPKNWKTVVAEGDGVIDFVQLVNNQFVVATLVKAHHQLAIHDLKGKKVGEIELPDMGTVMGLSGRTQDKELFVNFQSFLIPPTILRYDFAGKELSTLWEPATAFERKEFVTEQHTYKSKDGTEVTIFLTHKKGLQRDGGNPTLLYGYGGFSISLTPTYHPQTLYWIEKGGVFAVANLRGGNEYGDEWHRGGMLTAKQNVFDDFIAAAEWLIERQYTRTEKLAIHGRSNGGLLTAAVTTQRPDLFGAVLCGVGVLDMLRYHHFTAGKFWVAEYGDPADKKQFQALYAYSPLHNIKPGTSYPPMLIYTAESDDRVVPMHSLKFTAAIQAADGGDNPLLLRMDTRAGHGLGKPTGKLISEYCDLFTFLYRMLELS